MFHADGTKEGREKTDVIPEKSQVIRVLPEKRIRKERIILRKARKLKRRLQKEKTNIRTKRVKPGLGQPIIRDVIKNWGGCGQAAETLVGKKTK